MTQARFTPLVFAAALSLGTCMTPLAVQQSIAADGFSCAAVPTPVIGLEFGSRYTDDSVTRSDIDEVSNAEVDKALAPVEKYIGALSKMANAAYLDDTDREARIACVGTWLSTWAEAGALTELTTLNARLAVPARFAGIALALLQVETVGTIDPAQRQTIVAWLEGLGSGMTDFFDNDAPPKSSKNNLRAWAGLAAGAIGLASGDDTMVKWGADSTAMIICEADADGSLPLEMGRADRALNYQLHAVAPLVVTTDLLADHGFDGYSVCDGKLAKIAEFSVAAAEDPALVEKITGKQQTFSTGKQKLEPYMLAWVEPFLARNSDPQMDAFVSPLRDLSHSKLGGNMTRMQGWTDHIATPA